MQQADRILTVSISGALVTMVPLYLAEVAAPEIRGRVVGTTGIMIAAGYTSASWIGFGFYFVHVSNAQWRIPTAIQCIPALILAIGVWWLPESPRWRQYLLYNPKIFKQALIMPVEEQSY
jgi:MFS family permease